MTSCVGSTLYLSRDGDLNFDTGLQADARDLLDNLARGVEVNEALVDFEFVPVPGLGSFTTRRLAGGDLEDLGGETNGALHAKLLVLGAVDEVIRKLFEVLDIAAGEGDANFVEFCGGQGSFLSLQYHFFHLIHNQLNCYRFIELIISRCVSLSLFASLNVAKLLKSPTTSFVLPK